MTILQLCLFFLLPTILLALTPLTVSRSDAIRATISTVVGFTPFVSNTIQSSSSSSSSWRSSEMVPYELRDRKKNKNAIVREDYWYMMGKTPPRRLLEGQLAADNPQWNAWGSCTTSKNGENSCTYVPLQQRIPAYNKLGLFISEGAKEFGMIGKALEERDWDRIEGELLVESSPPPACVDALLKMVLFATSMLTTPNYSGPSREMLVARFYVNEAGFATQELKEAVKERDMERAKAAWEFGRDSWNSYLVIVNRQVNGKVGEKFELI